MWFYLNYCLNFVKFVVLLANQFHNVFNYGFHPFGTSGGNKCMTIKLNILLTAHID